MFAPQNDKAVLMIWKTLKIVTVLAIPTVTFMVQLLSFPSLASEMLFLAQDLLHSDAVPPCGQSTFF